ncbi:hypothetical protein LZ578_00480 [Jeotgalibaca sp. MA1X17-3]|uniref:hypothetical protein n=1 Tax=Jeotgalibaca sp. MA1X17-3 TaxID=2908211 RepID=UPI001F2ED4B0|nr:hypothetical protein [Jeotgalibaca sp. MA1X17-3]UJF15722.1 hypothetical protein LZ578_00480 [Jeotgalibaca sp. MA1X17-3]
MKRIHADYRTIDLLILSILAIACEVTSTVLHQRFINSGFYMSFSYLIVLIALIRWKESGVVVSLALTLPLIYYSQNITVGLIIYYILTSGSVIVIPFIMEKIKKVMKQEGYISYGIVFYLVTLLARGIFSFLVGLSPIVAIQQTMLQLNFSVLISCLVLLLLKNTEGLLVNLADHYKIGKEVVK